MKATVNGNETELSEKTVFRVRDSLFPGCDICILNGKIINGDCEIPECSRLYFAESGDGNVGTLITVRNSPGIANSLGNKTVGIAGAGGLGSNIATCLARSGIGKIVCADFDRVEPSNLNRQNYDLTHLGLYKTEALKEVLGKINPSVEVETHICRLTEENIPRIFAGCDAVCEAFDRADAKIMILCTVTDKMPGIPIVMGNGMAGYGDPSDMKTENIAENVYMCGDGRSDSGTGIMAPRVSICAAMMANKILQLLSQRK